MPIPGRYAAAIKRTTRLELPQRTESTPAARFGTGRRLFGNLKGGEELLALRDHGQVVNFLDVSKVKGPSEDLLRLLVFGPKGCHDRIEKVTKQYVSGLD